MRNDPVKDPVTLPGSPEHIVSSFFRKSYPELTRKIQLQVRRTPRRQTGPYKTNRESRWKLDPTHPDYTAADQIPRIEAKLFATTLDFEGAPKVPSSVRAAAAEILGHQPAPGAYRCPVSGRSMNFGEMVKEAKEPKHGRSSFHVGHIKPKAVGGTNTAENTYWTTDLGNRIQGEKSWFETAKIIIEMAEFHRRRENVSWGEIVNRYLG